MHLPGGVSIFGDAHINESSKKTQEKASPIDSNKENKVKDRQSCGNIKSTISKEKNKQGR